MTSAVSARALVSIAIIATLGLAGCANEVGDSDPDALQAQSAALDVDPALLASGRRSVVVTGIAAAENLLFTDDGRLFVSADGGIFEVVRNGTQLTSKPLISGESCSFGGLAQSGHTLYANCYDFTDSRLYAAALEATPHFRVIYSLPGIALANGLTSDGAGNLYVAATFQSQILRLHIAARDPFAIESQQLASASSGLFTNGLKYFGGALYWTDFGTVKTATLLPSGRLGFIRTLTSQLAFFDDLWVDGSGIVVASALDGSLRGYDLRGFPTGATQANALNGPSAVRPADGRLGLPAAALVVTERGGNQLSVLAP